MPLLFACLGLLDLAFEEADDEEDEAEQHGEELRAAKGRVFSMGS